MKSILALDIETECAVEGCPGYGKATCEEKHALSPWHSRITVIGVYGNDIRKVYRTVADFNSDINGNYREYNFVMHNGKFDCLHLLSRGVDVELRRFVADTQLMAYVLTEKISDQWLEQYEEKRKEYKGQRKAGKHSLKTLAPYFLGVEPFWEQDEKDDDEYVLKDCEYTFRLCSVLTEKLKARGEFEFYETKQLPWAKLLLRAELRGIKIDLDALDTMEAELTERAEQLKQQLDEQWHDGHVAYTDSLILECNSRYAQMSQATGQFLWNSERYTKLHKAALRKIQAGVSYDSPAQMLWLLRDYYNYDCTSLEGKDGTGREILERLANEGKDDVKIYLEWRKCNKILSAFLPSYKELQTGSIIHPIYNPDSTRTGRTSSERPNLQQVSGTLKQLFRARAGYSFIGMDAAAIEARIIALYTSDPKLYDIVTSGSSIHDHNVQIFFGRSDVPLEEISKELPRERKTAKNIGFGLFYSAGVNRIRITFAQNGFHLSEYECKQILSRFRETYFKAFEFNRAIIKEMESGAVIPNLLGRPIKIYNVEDAYMTALNTIVQSSASDLNLEAARRAQEEYDNQGLDAHVVAFIHDAVIVEAHDSVAIQAEAILKRCMTNFELNCDLGPISLDVEGWSSTVWEK